MLTSPAWKTSEEYINKKEKMSDINEEHEEQVEPGKEIEEMPSDSASSCRIWPHGSSLIYKGSTYFSADQEDLLQGWVRNPLLLRYKKPTREELYHEATLRDLRRCNLLLAERLADWLMEQPKPFSILDSSSD